MPDEQRAPAARAFLDGAIKPVMATTDAVSLLRKTGLYCRANRRSPDTTQCSISILEEKPGQTMGEAWLTVDVVSANGAVVSTAFDQHKYGS